MNGKTMCWNGHHRTFLTFFISSSEFAGTLYQDAISTQIDVYEASGTRGAIRTLPEEPQPEPVSE